MKSLVASLVIVVASPTIAKGEPIDIADFLVDAHNYAGQTITITGGVVATATTTDARYTASAGSFWLDLRGVDRATLRRALKNCSSTMTKCAATVTGRLESVNQLDGSPILKDVRIEWRKN
jgi:hypothetical protein